MTTRSSILVLFIAAVLCAAPALPAAAGTADVVRSSPYDPVVAEMISAIDERALYGTTYDLQNLSTRAYPSEGNTRAAAYLHDRLAAIPGLEVEYGDDEYRNVVATLRGRGPSSGEVVIAGAHYDRELWIVVRDRDDVVGAALRTAPWPLVASPMPHDAALALAAVAVAGIAAQVVEGVLEVAPDLAVAPGARTRTQQCVARGGKAR